jgi:hypothetical protein
MEMKRSSAVADLSDEQRKLLESLIGAPLEPEQVLYWVVVNPGKEPAEADKARARAGLQQLFAKADRHADEQRVSPEEFGEATDEAVRQVRSRRGE